MPAVHVLRKQDFPRSGTHLRSRPPRPIYGPPIPSPLLFRSKFSLTCTPALPFYHYHHHHFTSLTFPALFYYTLTSLRLNTTILPSGHQRALALKDIPISICRLLRVRLCSSVRTPKGLKFPGDIELCYSGATGLLYLFLLEGDTIYCWTTSTRCAKIALRYDKYIQRSYPSLAFSRIHRSPRLVIPIEHLPQCQDILPGLNPGY